MIEFVKDLEAYTAKKYPELQSRTFSISTNGTERTLITSDKADAYSFVPRANLSMRFELLAGGEPIDLYEVFGGLGQFRDLFHKTSE